MLAFDDFGHLEIPRARLRSVGQGRGIPQRRRRQIGAQRGGGLVEDLEFRIVPRRREARRAESAVPALFADEADGIADPVLRGIYRASRKRAHA